MLFYGRPPMFEPLFKLFEIVYDDDFAGIIFERILNLISAFPLISCAPCEHFFEHVPGGGVVGLFKSQSLLDEPCDDSVGYC